MNTWRTAPASRRHASGRFDLPAGKSRRAVERLGFVEIRRPVGRRHFGHAAEETLRRARPHQHKAVGAAGDEGGAAAQRAFALRHPPRIRFRVAARARRAAIIPRAQGASRLLRRTDGGAEVHHRLGEIAGAALRNKLAGAPADLAASPPAAAQRRQRAARSRARYCRRPGSPAHRTQSRRSPRRYRRRCREARATLPRLPETFRRDARPRRGRRHAGCGRGRSSRARPRLSAPPSSGAAASARTSGQRARKRA